VFSIDKKGGSGMTLVELAPDVTLDEIRKRTEANYQVRLTSDTEQLSSVA
jgi:3-oxoacid CoA-transferase subunit B